MTDLVVSILTIPWAVQVPILSSVVPVYFTI